MNVVLIPEDPRYDEHILKPVIQAMYDWIGVAGYTVQMAPGNLGGDSAATDWSEIEPIIDRMKYMTDLFLLCIDRDGIESRRTTDSSMKPDQIDRLRDRAQDKFAEENRDPQTFFGVAAREEVEVWALGGAEGLPNDWSWSSVRSHPDPKETYFDPFAQQRGLAERQFGGRKALGNESASNYDALRQKCSELERLEGKIEDWLTEHWDSF